MFGSKNMIGYLMWICFENVKQMSSLCHSRLIQKGCLHLQWLWITSDAAGNDSHFLDLRCVGMMSSSGMDESQWVLMPGALAELFQMILKRNQSGYQYLKYFTCCICVNLHFKRMVSNIMHRINAKCPDVESLVVGQCGWCSSTSWALSRSEAEQSSCTTNNLRDTTVIKF